MTLSLLSTLVPLVLIGLVVFAIRRATGKRNPSDTDPHAVRRLFQYTVLYGLLVIVAIGLSGLLGRLFSREVVIAGAESGLARDLSFVVVGGPLLAGMAFWSRRRLAQDPAEARSIAWPVYAGAAALTSLLVAAFALQQVLAWVVGIEDWSGPALARTLVWGGLWGLHWWLDGRLTPGRYRSLHLLLGSLIGLLMAAAGLAGMLSGGLETLVGLEGGDVLASGESPLLWGLVGLAVGAPIWLLYWLRTASRRPAETLWLAYVLLAGVALGLVAAVVSGSALILTILVWLVGDPGSSSALEHFDGAPTAAAGVVVWGLVWRYHQGVLQQAGATGRSEVRRLYEYLISAIGLVAAGVGLVLVVAALVEAVAGDVLAAGAPINTLLGALTAIAVGGTVWWLHWRMIRRAVALEAGPEVRSLVRRTYLVVLFGVGGVAAVIAMLVGVYLLFQDTVEGTLGVETVRRTRFALGVLLTTAAVAAYHAALFRSDRQQLPAEAERHGPSFVLLVGPADPEIAAAVARRTHATVQAWSTADHGTAGWSRDAVLAALEASGADEVVVLAEPDGVRAIPVRRR